MIEDEKDVLFVEEYLLHEDQDDAAVIACRKAGLMDAHFPISVTARRQLERPEIQIAIKAARPHFKKRDIAEITRDTILADMETVFHSTILAKDHSAANANRMGVAKILGLIRENVTVTHRLDVKSLSDEELGRIAARGSKMIEGEAKDITPIGIGHMKVPE